MSPRFSSFFAAVVYRVTTGLLISISGASLAFQLRAARPHLRLCSAAAFPTKNTNLKAACYALYFPAPHVINFSYGAPCWNPQIWFVIRAIAVGFQSDVLLQNRLRSTQALFGPASIGWIGHFLAITQCVFRLSDPGYAKKIFGRLISGRGSTIGLASIQVRTPSLCFSAIHSSAIFCSSDVCYFV